MKFGRGNAQRVGDYERLLGYGSKQTSDSECVALPLRVNLRHGESRASFSAPLASRAQGLYSSTTGHSRTSFCVTNSLTSGAGISVMGGGKGFFIRLLKAVLPRSTSFNCGCEKDSVSTPIRTRAVVATVSPDSSSASLRLHPLGDGRIGWRCPSHRASRAAPLLHQALDARSRPREISCEARANLTAE